MLEITLSSQCKRDIRKSNRRGKDINKLETIANTLAKQKPLAKRHRDHALSGDYIGMRECHIEPDWLLVYKINLATKELRLVRTGTHADLFSQ